MRNLLSLVGGMAVGAVAALLLTPYTGEELRAKIRTLIQEKMPNLSKERLEELVDEVVEKVAQPEAAEA